MDTELGRPRSIDEVVHAPVRLAMLALLSQCKRLDYAELCQQLELTDGNASSHLLVLKRHGYVRAERSAAGERRRTTYLLTDIGRIALANYLEAIEEVMRIVDVRAD